MNDLPLSRPTTRQLEQLCWTLWSFKRCSLCQNGRPCQSISCPEQRLKRLTRFFDRYKELTASYQPIEHPSSYPALQKHKDLFTIIETIKFCPEVSRSELKAALQTRSMPSVSEDDLDQAIDIAVRCAFMTNCSAQTITPKLLEDGSHQTLWQDNVTFVQFFNDSFPFSSHPDFGGEAMQSNLDVRSQIKARKLKKRAGLTFKPTDDIRCHLKLDHKRNTVQIFHFTSFLKENLRVTFATNRSLSTAEALKLYVISGQQLSECVSPPPPTEGLLDVASY